MRHKLLRTASFAALLLGLAVAPRPAAGQPCPEPDDAPQQAQQIGALPFATTCMIDTQGDVDWYRIVMSAGVGYEFDVSSPTNLDTALELYGPGDSDGDPTGPLVAQGDDEVGLQPQIIYVAPSSGFYFLKVKISDFAFPPDQTGDYTLDVFSFTPDTDDDPTTANQINLPYSNTHEISPDGDVDWYRVSMTNGFTYDFAAGSATSFDSAFWLYGPGTGDGLDTGPLVATDDDSGGNFQPFISYTATSDGWYYLRVAFSFNSPSQPSAKNSKTISAKALADVGPYTLTASSDEPMYVDLESIDATIVEGGKVRVRWRTASEVDNLGFELEMRRVDARGQTEWDALEFVPAVNAIAGSDYEHVVAPVLPGTVQIRLRMIATDGSFDYSPVITLAVEVANTFALGSVYPHPIHSTAQLNIAVSVPQVVTAELSDLLGRRVARVFDGALDANVTVPIELHAAGLPSGTYVLHLRGETFTASKVVTIGR